MPFLSVILAAEIIFAGIVLNINPGNTKNNILGIQLAQTDSSDNTQSAPPSDSSINTSNNPPPAEQAPQNSQPATDNSSSNNPSVPTQSSSNPADTPTENSQNSGQTSGQTSPDNQPGQAPANPQNPPSPYDAATDNSDNHAYFNDIINTDNQPGVTSVPQPQNSENIQNPTATPAETTVAPSISESVSPETKSSPTVSAAYPNQTAAVLDQNDLLNTPENINKQSIDEAKKEEDQMNQTSDPEEQTKLLINFASDKVKDINNFIKTDDFASTNFASQRLNAQIDKASENLANLTPAKARQLQKQLSNFCQQADYVLKTAELSVPEDAEQDLEINRAKCLDAAQ